MALIQINLVTPWTGSGGYSENRVAQRLTSMNYRNTQAFFALDRKRNFAKSDRRPLYPGEAVKGAGASVPAATQYREQLERSVRSHRL
jgi:hypothetical protein